MAQAPAALDTIPLVDLRAQYLAHQDVLDAAIHRVVEETAFIGGRYVSGFEAEFAAWCGAEHAIGVSNGTDALYLALRAAGIGPGDEVITVSHTFLATCEAISNCGATPVLVDVDDDTLTLSPDALAAAVTPRTTAIVAVHLYGHPVDMESVMAVAERHGLFVLEDAAQAHGASWQGRRVGTIGHATAFSCYPGKNLGAYGDAGVVTTGDAALAATVRQLRDHGRTGKYEHAVVGMNARLDGLQASILSAKLPHLDAWNLARRQRAARYEELLAGTDLRLPITRPGAEHVWHLYVVRSERRDDLLAHLQAAGVGAGIHYPLPVHLQPAYAHLGMAAGSLPVTEAAAARILSLPMFPELTHAQQDRVVAAVQDFA